MKRMACALALAAGTGVVLGASRQSALADPAPAAVASGLQVEVVSPSATLGDSTINLDVKFRGGNVRSIELYIDGTLIKQQTIRTRNGHGTIRFALDSALIPEGSHNVRVVAADAEGNTATATSHWNLAYEKLNAPIRFQYPRKNEMVQGVVPIEVKLDDTLRKPYVMFFVDNDFLALINFPPYTYNWDSARVPNGVHTLGVEAYDGETLAKVKAHSLQVTVNNPGGFTTRQNDIPDLNQKAVKPAPKIGTPTVRPPAESALPQVGPDVTGDPNLTMRRTTTQPHAYTVRSLPHIANTHSAPNPAGANARVTKPGPMALLAGPKDLVALNAPGSDLARVGVRPLRVGNIAARPSRELMAAPIAAPNAHGKVVARTAAGAAKAQVGAGSLLGIRGSTFDVAFDNTRIAFDVPPRVEHGLPFAPFRQIFEHTGGTVGWYSKSRLVRAVNSTREIEIKVGHKEARVNNQPVQMEAKPYIDRGRTIVPLSFIQDALDVNVQYDKQTGRMLIESKK